MKLKEEGRNGHVTPESPEVPARPWMLPGCEKEMTILANKISFGGRASSKCGKQPCTRAAQKTSWAWHQMRCCQASETSRQSGGAVGSGQLWGVPSAQAVTTASAGQRQAGQQAQSDASTSLTPSPGPLCFPHQAPAWEEEGERAATFPGPSHSVPSIVGFFFFFFLVSVSFSAGLILTGTQALHTLRLHDGNLISCLVSSTQPLLFLGNLSSFLNLLGATAGPECLKPLTSSLQNLLGIRWGHLCPFPWEGADLSQEVYFSTLLLEWDQVAFPWPWSLAKWTKSGHLIQLGQSWEYVALEDFG